MKRADKREKYRRDERREEGREEENGKKIAQKDPEEAYLTKHFVPVASGLSSVPRPTTFSTPAWKSRRQTIRENIFMTSTDNRLR